MAENTPQRPIDAQRPSQAEIARRRQKALLDEALKETFPASDPISPALSRRTQAPRS
jgi:hypothetical protein